MSADMSDSVKQKKPIHCRLHFGGFSLHMQGIGDCYVYQLTLVNNS